MLKQYSQNKCRAVVSQHSTVNFIWIPPNVIALKNLRNSKLLNNNERLRMRRLPKKSMTLFLPGKS